MQLACVKEIVSQVKHLTATEQDTLYCELTPWLSAMKLRTEQGTMEDLRDARFSKGLQCPRCESDQIKRNGRFKDKQGILKQRYLCKECGRTFNDLTGTPLAYSKRQNLWGKRRPAWLKACPCERRQQGSRSINRPPFAGGTSYSTSGTQSPSLSSVA